MFVHIWRMRARKKRAKDYETFGRQLTLAALKKIDGCQEAYFFKVFEARKPEYLWVAFWRDQKALEAARANPAWREQKRKFEAGKFYKTIPLELVCECLGSFGGLPTRKPQKIAGPVKTKKNVRLSPEKGAILPEISADLRGSPKEEQPTKPKSPAADAAAPTPEGA
jgi:heme-degrading monooxygenase HmoA